MKKSIANAIAKKYFGSFKTPPPIENIRRPTNFVVAVAMILILFCGQFLVFNGASLAKSLPQQSQLVSIGILSFQDESGLNLEPEFGQKIAQDLQRKLVQTYKDVLPRFLNLNGATASTLSVEEFAAFGKKSGVKFIVRGGLLAVNVETTDSETKTTVQIYADLIAVETASQISARAEGLQAQQNPAPNNKMDLSSVNFSGNEFHNSPLGQAFASALEQLATNIYQALKTPQETPQKDTSVATNPTTDAAVSPQTDATKAADIDEELQQLIAQAEAIVTNNAGANTDNLKAINQALKNMKNALEAKAQLLEQAKDTAPADQEILLRKQELQTAVVTAMQQVSSADQTTSTPQPSREKKNLLASIGGYLGDAMGVMQKIQEMRSLLRSGNENYASNQASGYSGGEPNAVVEEPTSEVNGVVTDAGNPVEGATVTDPESGANATTDSNGSYTLRGIASGRLAKISITKSGKQLGNGQIDVVRGRAAVADFDLSAQTNGNRLSVLRVIPSTVMVNTLQPQTGNTGILKGRVLDQQGKPIARALVTIKGLAMARTDSQGLYTFMNVPAGLQQLSIQKSGLVLKSQQVQVTAKNSNESEVRYSASDSAPKEPVQQTVIVRGSGATLRGRIFDNEKNPLAGAKVTALTAASAVSVLSNEKGKFELRDLKQGQYRLLVAKAGFDNNAQTIQLGEGKSESLEVQLKKSSSTTVVKVIEAQRQRLEEIRTPPNATPHEPIRQPDNLKGQLTGHIVDAQSGKPLQGAIVSLQGQAAAKTDNDGNYSVSNVTQGNYRISVNKTGFAEQAKTVSIRGGNATREDFSLRKDARTEERGDVGGTRGDAGNTRMQPSMPSRNGQLRGQIVDAKTGKPLAGASIFLANQQAGVSNQAGAFAISNLPQGNYSVVVKMNGYMDAGGTVAIRAGEAITTSFRLNPKAPVIRLRSNLVQAN